MFVRMFGRNCECEERGMAGKGMLGSMILTEIRDLGAGYERCESY